MQLSMIFITGDDDPSGTIVDALEALVGRVVNLHLNKGVPSGYPTKDEDVFVVRTDSDGDLVVCELDERGNPQANSSWAIPQSIIRRVYVRLGAAA